MQLTTMSANELNTLRYRRFSPTEAREYLEGKLPIRRFSETLRAFSKMGVNATMDDDALKKQLIQMLAGYPGSPALESIERKVRDWLNDKYVPNARQDYIKLCFALGLSEDDAYSFLAIASDGDLHIRDPYELSCACTLRFRGAYPEALATCAQIEEILSDASIPTLRDKDELTGTLRAAFHAIHDKESLLSFAREYKGAFGKQKNTAFQQFKKCIQLLKSPKIDEDAYSVEEIMRNYLSMNLPTRKSKSQYNTLQKLILASWPDATSIYNMSNRKTDITRKVLALLFLITDGAPDYDDTQEEDELEDEDEISVFDDCYYRMNAMLTDCGFSPLDPRNVFDWLCISCLKSTTDDGADAQMEKVLALLFPHEN